jgi:hypothetical protein
MAKQKGNVVTYGLSGKIGVLPNTSFKIIWRITVL